MVMVIIGVAIWVMATVVDICGALIAYSHQLTPISYLSSNTAYIIIRHCVRAIFVVITMGLATSIPNIGAGVSLIGKFIW